VALGGTPVVEAADALISLGQVERAGLTDGGYLLATWGRLNQRRSWSLLVQSGGVNFGAPYSTTRRVAYGLEHLSRGLGAPVAVTYGNRSPLTLINIGNRLARVHAHLALTQQHPSAKSVGVARLLGRLLRADRMTGLTFVAEAPVYTSPVSLCNVSLQPDRLKGVGRP